MNTAMATTSKDYILTWAISKKEIDMVINIAKSLKNEGAFSVMPISRLSQETGYTYQELNRILSKHDRVFLNVDGGYKLRSSATFNRNTKKLENQLKFQRKAAIFFQYFFPMLVVLFFIVVIN